MRGSISDLFMIIVLLGVVIGVGVLIIQMKSVTQEISGILLEAVNDSIENKTIRNTTYSGIEESSNKANEALGIGDALFVALYFTSMIGSIVTAFLFRGMPPVFFVLFLIFDLIILYATTYTPEVLNAITSEMPEFATEFPITYVVIKYLPIITLFFSAILSVVVYGI